MNNDLRARMQRAVDNGRAAPLELALTDWALRHHASAPVAVAFATGARAIADGHSCLALDRADVAVPGEQPFCDRADLDRALAHSELVGAPGASKPLILDGDRLYLQRYWAYENRLASRLRERLAVPPEAIDTAALAPGGGVFDYGWVGNCETHWQAVAAFVAARHRFAVISGGPGTGKTYTLLRLMRLLIESALSHASHAPLIRLAAPTGKAAARMMESIRAGLDDMELPETVRAAIPRAAKTLHRTIGISRNTPRARHTRDNPLAADVVIVDEASMIDLPMMAKLVEALGDRARLILLGDRYQLASVESGSVLAELCNAGGINAFTRAQRAAAGPLLRGPVAPADSPLGDHVVTLQASHRFSAGSPIGQLATAVIAGDADRALAIAAGNDSQIEYLTDTGARRLDALVDTLAEHYAHLISETDPARALGSLQQQCLLCAVRRGPTGSTTFNQRITQALAAGHGFDANDRWYHGRPIIVTRNDYRAGLYNGDTGVCLAGDDGRMRVWFATEDGPRAFLPTALPEHDTVYAMTVHKSQGSEFDAVTLVLPSADTPVLTRELLYTGITRARKAVTLIGADTVLKTAIERRIERFSGLAERLAT